MFIYIFINLNIYFFFFCCDCSITLKCNNTCNIGYNFKKNSQQKNLKNYIYNSIYDCHDTRGITCTRFRLNVHTWQTKLYKQSESCRKLYRYFAIRCKGFLALYRLCAWYKVCSVNQFRWLFNTFWYLLLNDYMTIIQ